VNRSSSHGSKVQRLRDRLREATAESILAAAEEVFASDGPHGAGMSEIARHAGVAVGTLYNHFADREALLTALLHSRRGELYAELERRVDALPAGAAPRSVLTAFLSALFGHFDAHRPFFDMLMQHEGALGDAKADHKRELYRRVEALIARLEEAARIPPERRALHAALLMGLIRGACMRAAYSGERRGQPLQPLAEEIADFFLKGARR
jgi:AcrR family transcriptional regulator